jgi:membrane protease YdiL (CAAX protease family)
MLWRSTSFLDPLLLARVPLWLLFAVTGIVPQVLLLIYPLVTRRQPTPCRFHPPSLKRLLCEAVIAVPLIFACLLLVTVAEFAITRLFPGTSFVPHAYDHMAKSTATPLLYGFLLAAVLFGPIAEEVFFRGFLFNAFRQRMPVVAATFLQAVLFGFAHFMGAVPATAAALLGLVLALIYYWRQTIFAPIFVHAGYNTVAAATLLLTMHANASAPVLGVTPQPATTECVIGTVIPNSPAEAAGLLPGDTIAQLDDYPITDFQNLIETVSCYRAGDSVVVTLKRDGDTMRIPVVLAPRSSLSALQQ